MILVVALIPCLGVLLGIGFYRIVVKSCLDLHRSARRLGDALDSYQRKVDES